MQTARFFVGSLCLSILQYSPSVAQTVDNADQLSVTLRAEHVLQATKLIGPAPNIDGVLSDVMWTEADTSTPFVQLVPRPGDPSTFPTGVQVVYDRNAVYVAMRLFDSAPDSVTTRLTRRDVWSETSDWAHVYLASYGDRRTAFRFSVNPSGVKLDAIHHGDTQEDSGWDAVWDVGVRRDSIGWTAEFRIPLSQLRFASSARGEELRWGLNFGRFIARFGERSYWSPIPADAARFVSAFGTLTGLVGLSAPGRLEVQPYVLSRLTRAPGVVENPFHRVNAGTATFGADIRYGVTSDFTLNLAVNPDFGQVEADPSEVNLSAFESFFREKRPFFLEGTDLFRVTFPMWPPLVHSRRIGRRPRGRLPSDARFVDRPDASSILVASKLTGKTSGGLSIGVMNAITQRESARYLGDGGVISSVPVEPSASFTAARVTKDFREGQSAVGIIATATNRGSLDDFLGSLHKAAYVGGVDWRHRFGAGIYETSGSLVASKVRGDSGAIALTQRAPGRRFQRSDATHLEFDPTRTSLAGNQAAVRLAKIGGGHWRWQINGTYVSPGFEVNDLGFQNGSDRVGFDSRIGFVQFEPSGPFRRWQLDISHSSGWTSAGEQRYRWLQLFGNGQLKNHWRINFGVDRTFAGFSTEALRGGPGLREPGYVSSWLGLTTDPRQSVNFNVWAFGMRFDEDAGHRLNVEPRLTLRPSDRADVSVATGVTWFTTETQYIGTFEAGGAAEYVFGRLRQKTVSLTTRLNYTFNPNLSLQLYAQPFSSVGRYDRYKAVLDPSARRIDDRFDVLGEAVRPLDDGLSYAVDKDADGVDEITFRDPDFDFRQLRSNVVLRWEFRPGSTLFAVWSQNRGAVLPTSPFDLDGTNIFLLKFSYWLAR